MYNYEPEEQNPTDMYYEGNNFDINGPQAPISDNEVDYVTTGERNYQYPIINYQKKFVGTKLSPVMEVGSWTELDTVGSNSFEIENEFDGISPTIKSPSETYLEKETVTFAQTGVSNTFLDSYVYSLDGEGTTIEPGVDDGSPQSERQLNKESGPEHQQTHDIVSDQPSQFGICTFTPKEPHTYEVKNARSDTIAKFEGYPEPLTFINKVVSVSPESNDARYFPPDFNKSSIESSQFVEPRKLSLGTGERNPNADSSQILTQKENETYTLNIDQAEDDEETKEHLKKVESKTHRIEYLKAEVGVALKQALAEIVRIKPKDPIHYLGHWLFKWRQNQISHKKDIEIINELVYFRRIQSFPSIKRESIRGKGKK